VRGTLERVIVETDDRMYHSSATTPATTWLRTTTSRIPLEDDAVRGIPTGSTVAVQLAIQQPSPDASPSTDRPRAVSSVSVLSRASTTPRTTATAAVHSITVVLALPSGNKPDKVTAASLTSIVNGGVSRFWSQESDGRISFKVSKAVGWTKLSSSCTNMWAVWDEVQRRIGFVPGQRRHLVIYAPPSAGCPTGLATVGSAANVGGNVTVGGTTTSLIAHELGHNLGLGHSEALTCSGRTDAVITAGGFGPSCHQIPYGDWYDVMGISWENLGSLSTAHAFRLGLLSAATAATARGPLRVTLRPVSTRVGVRTLRVVDPSGSTYVIEYRPASGADAWLSTSADWRGLDPGVLLRRINPEDPTQTLLLDPTPSASGSDGDIEVALPAGRTVTTASGRGVYRGGVHLGERRHGGSSDERRLARARRRTTRATHQWSAGDNRAGFGRVGNSNVLTTPLEGVRRLPDPPPSGGKEHRQHRRVRIERRIDLDLTHEQRHSAVELGLDPGSAVPQPEVRQPW
jgi:hypothetical protein